MINKKNPLKITKKQFSMHNEIKSHEPIKEQMIVN